MNPILIWMIIFAIVLALPFLIMNFFTQGFALTFIRVFLSRGKLTMVQIEKVTDDVYFRAGRVEEDHLYWKAAVKDKKQRDRVLTLPPHAVRRWMGIKVVTVDEAKNSVIMPDKTAVEGHDAVKTDSLMKRIAMLPTLEDKKDIIIIVVCILIVAILVGFDIYLDYEAKKLVAQCVVNNAAVGEL